MENLLCAKRRAGASERRTASKLLSRVGLADVQDRYPRELPFGLQKRADLARAVAEGADLVLLDEPFGGLDETERKILADQIRDLKDAGATVVIVDHVLDDLFSVTDRVVAFDFGTPIAAGTSSVVMQDARVRSLLPRRGPGTSERHALPRDRDGTARGQPARHRTPLRRRPCAARRGPRDRGRHRRRHRRRERRGQEHARADRRRAAPAVEGHRRVPRGRRRSAEAQPRARGPRDLQDAVGPREPGGGRLRRRPEGRRAEGAHRGAA